MPMLGIFRRHLYKKYDKEHPVSASDKQFYEFAKHVPMENEERKVDSHWNDTKYWNDLNKNINSNN